MKTIKSLFTYTIFTLFIFGLTGFTLPPDDEDPRVKKLISQLEKFYFDFPQEKVYLHLDKSEYVTGDRIWIKGYLVDATTHKPATKSANLYVELLNSDNVSISTKRFKLNDGFAKGDFFLGDTIKEGFYHLRAFTSWMINFDNSLIPSYTVYVKNDAYKDFITKDKLRYNKKINRSIERAKNKLDVQFFPESGNLVEGLETRVAFKGINGLGEGVEVNGSIYDDDDNKITDIQSIHKGMGYFTLIPEADQKYYALVNEDEKFDLPKVKEEGAVLTIDNSDDELLEITLRSTIPEGIDARAADLILIGHSRGDVRFTRVISLDQLPVTLEVEKKQFLSGVNHWTLFNGRTQPVAERLIFVEQDEQLRFKIEQNMSSTFDEQASFDITAHDKDGRAVRSNLSVSVKPGFDNQESNTFNGNIETSLLLTSDIRGYVEDPEYYFSDTEEAEKALDMLMLTQGWRRFEWKNVITENYPEITNDRETGIAVEGRITRQFFSIPYANSLVELYVMDQYNDIYSTYSDEDGYFRFENLNYQDTINLELYAYKPSGKRNLVIELNEGKLPDAALKKMNYDRFVASKGIARYKLEAQKEQEMGESEDEDLDQPEHHKIHGDPDYVVTADQIPSGYSNIFDVLKGRVPGVAVSGNSINIRGVSSIMLSNEPLYLLDGVPIDVNGVSAINPQDVDRIEILSGPSSAIYGSRGANGVVAIYTKRGHYMKKGFLGFQMLGYYTPKEFYEPKYATFDGFEEFKSANPTIYWEADVPTSVSGSANVTFNLPPFEFPLIIEIEGISYDGRAGAETHEIYIR